MKYVVTVIYFSTAQMPLPLNIRHCRSPTAVSTYKSCCWDYTMALKIVKICSENKFKFRQM